MSEGEDDDVKRWRFDKRIPLGTVGALLIQGLIVFWAAAVMWSQVAEQGRRLEVLEAQKAGERLAVAESQIADIKAQLNRIEQKIDKIAERTAP